MPPLHTPGPWRLVGHSGTFFITQVADESEDGHHSHAKVYPATYHPTGWDACKAMAEANARLIAQAPAMLDALRTIADLAGQRGDDTSMDIEHLARAVLRAIEGKD